MFCQFVSWVFQMTVGFLIASAFMLGLLGSTHCVGMCGGIVSVLGCAQPKPNSQNKTNNRLMFWGYHAAYNFGRIFSYAIIGAIVAYISMKSAAVAPIISFPIGMIVSGLFMVLLGLYISGWWRVLTYLERAGTVFWTFLKPIGQKILPVTSLPHAFALGLVWGWLPCGLVYSTLGLAAVSTNPLLGALIMLSFGLGTLPMLLAVGGSAGTLNRQMQNINVRRFAGIVLILMGCASVFLALTKSHNKNMHHHSTAFFLPKNKLINYAIVSKHIFVFYKDGENNSHFDEISSKYFKSKFKAITKGGTLNG